MTWHHDKRTSHERGYGAAWRKKRLLILMRDHGICQPCKRQGRIHQGSEVDHILRKADGGTDDDANLQTICRHAHRRKTAEEDGKKWRVQIGADGWPADDGP